ncbi:MAG: hypothetical protein ACLQBD_05075 [Syntrophobacteraceae bacterium]
MLTKKQIPLIYLLLTAAAIVAFWQVSQCDFIHYDDPLYVSENIHIRDGISMQAIRWALTTCYAGNWHPLTWMSHMLDVQLYGLNPRWHHLTNLLFHIANTLLLFFVFHRMTKAPWKSAFVAALFAIHPLHVESVAWVSERKDVLSTFFWMLTMGAYINYVEHGTEDRRQRSEDRERRSEDRERRTEDRERRTEDGRQSREDGSSFSVIRFPLFGCSHIFCFRTYGEADACNSSLCPAAIGLLASAALRPKETSPANPHRGKSAGCGKQGT